MQALNHMVFGSLIAVTVSDPVIAVPAALASHFVLDSIPHYGDDPKARMGSRAYNYRILLDILACTLVMLLFLSLHPKDPTLVLVCGLIAILPDIFWPLALIVKQKGPLWSFFKFHKKIQTESPRGIYIEIIWFILTTALVIELI